MKLSIVIPVHNAQEYLRTGLDSILSQEFDSFEVICVDDASSDDSAQIMKEYAQKDERVHCIYHEENVSAAVCRKEGVLASSGDYVMFMDSDDYYENNALKTAYEAITKKDVDILQFGTDLENCAGLSAAQIQSNMNALRPYTEEPIRGDLLSACYTEGRIGVTLWNKIVRGTICRQAFAQIEDGYFPKANDLYATFLLYFYSSSFEGLNRQLYHYCFGRGMTGHREFDLKQFSVHCQGAKVYQALRRFAETVFEDDKERVSDALEKVKRRLLNEQLGKWRNNLREEDRQEGLSLIAQIWDGDEDFVLSAAADAFYQKSAGIADFMIQNFAQEYRPREIRTVMLYYRSIHGGGAQNVVAQLCNMFAADGQYRVVLVTDEGEHEEDFPLHERVERVTVPHVDEVQETGYLKRALAWKEILDEYPADVFLNSNWLAKTALFDMICIKKHPSRPAFVFHTHSFFAMIYRMRGDQMGEMLSVFAAADAVITLSDVDRQYWQHINRRSYMIGNPVFTESTPEDRAQAGTHILWVGRLSRGKHVYDVIRIMEHVVASVPEAVCDVVGSGDDDFMAELQEEIRGAGLADHIILHGQQSDMKAFYSRASVLLMTSEFEGFGLVFYESASYGVPTVLYELPWLEYSKGFKGFCSVPQRDTKAAAAQIVRLLKDDVFWKTQSDLLYDSYKEYEKYDIKAAWESVFADLEQNTIPGGDDPDVDEDIMLRQIARFHWLGKEAEAESFHEKLLQRSQKIRSMRDRIERLEERNEKMTMQKEVLKDKLQLARDEKKERDQKIQELEAEIRELQHPVKYAAKKVTGKGGNKDQKD